MFIFRQLNSRITFYVILCAFVTAVIVHLGIYFGSRYIFAIVPTSGIHKQGLDPNKDVIRLYPLNTSTPKPTTTSEDDEHGIEDNRSRIRSQDAKKTPYPPRLNMGECPKVFGKVVVFVAVVGSSYKTHYRVAQQSLECYLKSTNYTFKLVDLDHDERVNKHCKHDQLFFKKHCAASVYLQDADWMLVLDADTGVVNPNHCIEEFIDDRVDFVFYERLFNWEIASGNYLVKNTDFARNFLMKWADFQYIQPKNWNGADNGVLQIHILQTVLPDAKAEIKACDTIWRRGTNYETYMGYVTCVKVTLGAQRLYPGKLRILRRGHGWVRDGFVTGDSWSERDFMLHGWKVQEINKGWDSPFSKMFNVTECGQGYAGWNWKNSKRLGVEDIKSQFANFEQVSGKGFPKEARVHPHLSEPDIANCYPNCDDFT